MPWLRSIIFLTVLLASRQASAYEVDPRSAGASELDASQFKDFANEWAFAASPPMLGPTKIVPAWRPWVQISQNIRSVRLAPGSEEEQLRASQYAWLANGRLAKDPQPNIFLPAIEAGLGLPGGVQAGLLYGRSPNVNLQVAGFDLSYPFLQRSIASPGLWARFTYTYPTRLPGLRMHVPALGLYLTNEFMRTRSWGRPLSMHLHAGLHQSLIIATPVDLYERKVSGDEVTLIKREPNTFPGSTQFLLGFQVDRHRWSLHADAGYASSESTLDGEGRIRAFWNQSYRLAYRWD